MRDALGIVAILVTVLVVSLVLRRQLQTARGDLTPAAAGAVAEGSSGTAPSGTAATLRAEQQARDGIAAAAAEARRRNDAADAAP